MATKYWIKLYHEMLDDPKMGQLSDRLYRRAIECFLLAGDAHEDGLLPAVNDMAWRLRCNPEHLESELIELAKTGILSQHDGGWFVTKFAERQGTMSKAEYMARLRDEEQKKQHYQSTYQVRYQSVTNSNAEEDKEEDKDKEADSAAAAFRAYDELVGFGKTTRRVSDELLAFVDEVGSEMVIEAIREAEVHNKRSWSYVRAILKNWRDNGKGEGKPQANGKPDVAVLLQAMSMPYAEAKQSLEAAGAWPYVERMGKNWEDMRRMSTKDIEWAWKAVKA